MVHLMKQPALTQVKFLGNSLSLVFSGTFIGIFFFSCKICKFKMSLAFLALIRLSSRTYNRGWGWGDPTRGVYFQKFNPLLFARLGLPRTEIRPKHSEGVLWAQNKGHFWTQHPWKPLDRLLVWPYLWILNTFIFFELSAQLGRKLAICCESWVVIYAPGPHYHFIKYKNRAGNGKTWS